jgi:hypothetical protein
MDKKERERKRKIIDCMGGLLLIKSFFDLIYLFIYIERERIF